MKYFVILLFLSMLVGFAYAYEPVPAGIEVIEYGIFDKDGNVVHQLRADQPYQINVHFESELDVSVSFTYHVQILNKNKHWTEPVEEFNSSGILQPNEEKTISFEWIPKYDGKFRTLVGFGNNEDDTAIGSVPQYDFEVASEIKPPLKQIQSGIPFNEIQCKESLTLVLKYDGSPACVSMETKEKLIERGWTGNSYDYSNPVPDDVIGSNRDNQIVTVTWDLEEYTVPITLNNIVLDYIRAEYHNQKILMYVTMENKSKTGLVEFTLPKQAASLIFDNPTCTIFQDNKIEEFLLQVNQKIVGKFNAEYAITDNNKEDNDIILSITTPSDSSAVEIFSMCSSSLPPTRYD